MDRIQFKKMNGCGNDFIVIDNRKRTIEEFELSNFAKVVCMRRFHVGADGLILLEDSELADVKMRYFNSDGNEGEMCGNGARCFVKYAYLKGVVAKEMTFETMDGIYEGKVLHDTIQIKFPSMSVKDFHLNQPFPLEEAGVYHFGWVGVPHTVCIGSDTKEETDKEFIEWAKPIRYNKMISKSGTNVNKIELVNKNEINIRTYERGVEDETFACGSGSVASAIISNLLGEVLSPVEVHTKGGTLTVTFQIKQEHVHDIFLEGNAVVVAEGELLLNSVD